ncbi:hypothetical protein, partial [Klebsiella pneumoniae]|uniref:hypothetical protein n=1 Tax=Klebsiella pneumoniae TaxID=573 RepID=UPI001FAA961C
KRAYCLKTQPATGETYPKSDLFNKAIFMMKNLFLAAIHWLKTIAGVIFIPKMITMLKLINLTIINL